MYESRRFMDAYGFAWQVCEIGPAGYRLADVPADVGGPRAEASSRGLLYFFSRGTTLTLRDYPANWDELSWTELDVLRGRAEVLGSDTPIRLQALATSGTSRGVDRTGVASTSR